MVVSQANSCLSGVPWANLWSSTLFLYWVVLRNVISILPFPALILKTFFSTSKHFLLLRFILRGYLQAAAQICCFSWTSVSLVRFFSNVFSPDFRKAKSKQVKPRFDSPQRKMKNRQIKWGSRMQEKDRNRAEIEMEIKCLDHKAVLYFHTGGLPFLMLSWKNKQEKLWQNMWDCHHWPLCILTILLNIVLSDVTTMSDNIGENVPTKSATGS